MVAQLKQDERLAPGFGRDDLEQVLADHPQAKTIMLVGHEPDFSLTISALIGGGKVILKKGGLTRVDITTTDPLRGTWYGCCRQRACDSRANRWRLRTMAQVHYPSLFQINTRVVDRIEPYPGPGSHAG